MTRTERLRSALQQLRASKAGGGSAAPLHSPPDAAPQTRQLPEPPPRAMKPAPALPAPAMPAAAEADSDPEDWLDDISLSLLARLRLGGSGAATPAAVAAAAGVPAAAPPQAVASLPPSSSEVTSAARRVLVEAAAEAEMPELACRPGLASPADADLQSSAAAMHQRLEQLRASLRSPCGHAPAARPTLAGSPAAQGPAHVLPPAAAAAFQEPRRQRLAAAELVVTRPPSRAAAAAPPSLGSASEQRQRPYSSGGATAEARLAALLSQPASQPYAGALQLDWAHPVSAGVGHSYASSTSLARPPPLPPPQLPPWGCPTARPPLSPQPPCSTNSTAMAAAAAAAGCSGGDILEAWRRRRQAAAGQAGLAGASSSLADKYSRYLSLQQQGPPPQPPSYATAQVTPAAAASTAAVAAGLQGSGSSTGPRPATVTPASSASQQPEGDILERWRARRRAQQASGSASASASVLAPTLASLLTLQAPPPPPAVAAPPSTGAAGGRPVAAGAAAEPEPCAAAQQAGVQDAEPEPVKHLPPAPPAHKPPLQPPPPALQQPEEPAPALPMQPEPAQQPQQRCPADVECAVEPALGTSPSQDGPAESSADSQLALALRQSASELEAAGEPCPGPRLPSRTASAASSGRATPLSSLAYDRWVLPDGQWPAAPPTTSQTTWAACWVGAPDAIQIASPASLVPACHAAAAAGPRASAACWTTALVAGSPTAPRRSSCRRRRPTRLSWLSRRRQHALEKGEARRQLAPALRQVAAHQATQQTSVSCRGQAAPSAGTAAAATPGQHATEWWPPPARCWQRLSCCLTTSRGWTASNTSQKPRLQPMQQPGSRRLQSRSRPRRRSLWAQSCSRSSAQDSSAAEPGRSSPPLPVVCLMKSESVSRYTVYRIKPRSENWNELGAEGGGSGCEGETAPMRCMGLQKGA